MPRSDGRRPIVVDGVTCYWGVERDDYGLSCRIITPTATIRFQDRIYSTDRFGWWETPVWVDVVTPKHVMRAVKIAGGRTGEFWLDEHEVDEVLLLTRRTIETELIDADAALRAYNVAALVHAWLAIGCRNERHDLVDDWIASHADQLLAVRADLQARLDAIAHTQRSDYHQSATDPRRTRSAIEFLAARCTRLAVELALDPAAADAYFEQSGERITKPVGIPASHWWWTD